MKKITFLLLAILPILAFGQFDQLITNHTFDADVSGWNSNGTHSWDATEGFTTPGSGKFEAAAGNNFRSSPNTPLDYAGDYTVTFRVKGTTGTTIKAQFFGCCGNPSGPEVNMTGDWIEYTHTFTALETGNNSNLRIIAVTSGTFYIDDAYFTFNLPAGSTLLTTNVSGSGTVVKSPDQSYYTSTDNVSLTPQPTTHWQFNNWSGDLTGSANPGSILMDANKTVTANFIINPSFDYNFTFNTDNDLEGWTTDAQLNLASHTGGEVTLVPTADQWARFNLFDFPIPAASYNKLTIVLKNESTGDDEITAIAINGTDTQVAIPQTMTTSDSGFQTYTFNMTELSNWNGDVNSIRIRFTASSKAGTATEGRSSGTGNIIINSVAFEFDSSLSTNDFDSNSIAIYPNPATSQITINGVQKISEVRIFDVMGKQVLKTNTLSNNQLNINQLNSGVYLVRIQDVNNFITVKRIIKK
ncbi:T9SS type A sorting domain-containing protein [Pseudotamlana agarivorans]|uniref:T9SS type A sorting domain-containing protein n=1 Tax=Pseudotamlana agarivorans TaxID=481183 RepID=UPI00082E6478|nr:T9SS type A sorting domain-containing protein [Tamlana agarivorans]